jgi:serine/threonine protein kinase
MHFDAPDVGSTVGPWLLQEHVGSGSFGIVYRAQRAEQPDSPPVAVKMARRPNDPRFEREAELLRRCVHPSIPRFVELGFWPGPEQLRYPYITMECVQGPTLYRWLQAQPRTHRAREATVLVEMGGPALDLPIRRRLHRIQTL